jgi:hypothetical protein
MIHTPGEPTVSTTASDASESYHYYEVARTYTFYGRSADEKGVILLLAESLLELAQYVEANRPRLEQEAKEDATRHQKAWNAEMQDMNNIDREWRAYRNEE